MNFWFLAGIVMTLLPLPPVAVPPPPSAVVVVTNAIYTEPSVEYEMAQVKQHARMWGMLEVYVFICAWFIIFGCLIHGGRGGSSRDSPGSECGKGMGRWRGMP